MKRFKTLQMAVILLALACATLPALFIAVPLLETLHSQARAAAIRDMKSEVEMAAERASDILASIATSAKALAVDADIQKATQTILFAEAATSKFQNFVTTVPLIEGIVLYSADLSPRAAQPAEGATLPFPEALVDSAKQLLDPNLAEKANSYVVFGHDLYQLVPIQGLYQIPSGIIVVRTSGSKFLSFLSSGSQGNGLSLQLDEQLVAETKLADRGKDLLSAEAFRYIDQMKQHTGKIVLQIVEPASIRLAAVDAYALKTARNVAATIALSGIAGFLLAWLTLRAMKRIRTYVERLALGDFTAAAPTVTFLELRQITATLGDMGSRIVDLIDRERSQERARLEAQLNALRTQMNPHFLFNALNSIAMLTQSDPEKAGPMTTKLAELYRAIVGASKTRTVPLIDELKLVENYLGLEQVRFEARLTYEIKVDPACKAIYVPGLLLLTLVENSVKHGIAKLRAGGHIVLKIAPDEPSAMFKITISNPAPESKQGAASLGTATGLANTRERLSLLYADKHRLTVGQDSDGNYVVSFFISGEAL